tara:strand:- start:408 stop:512 length:105 start_codon:yes stop_codon:yes gene_type:complete
MTDKREQDHQGDAFKPIRWLLLALLFLAIIARMD